MTDSSTLGEGNDLPLLLARLIGMPDWETGKLPLYVYEDGKRSKGAQSACYATVLMAIDQCDSWFTASLVAVPPDQDLGVKHVAFNLSTMTVKSSQKRKLQKIKDSASSEDKQLMQLSFLPDQKTDLCYGDGTVPPFLQLGKPRVSVKMQLLESHVASVEKGISGWKTDSAVALKLLTMSPAGKTLSEEDIAKEIEATKRLMDEQHKCICLPPAQPQHNDPGTTDSELGQQTKATKSRSSSPDLIPQELDPTQPVADHRIVGMVAYMAKLGARSEKTSSRRDDTIFPLSHVVPDGLYAVLQITDLDTLTDESIWVVRCVGAAGFINAMSYARLQMAFEVESKPIPASDLGGRPPTVSLNEGNFVIDYSRVFLSYEEARGKLENVERAKTKPKTEGI